MKRLLFTCAFLLLACPSWAVPIALTQQTAQQSFAGAAGSQSWSFASPPAAGSLITCAGWIIFFSTGAFSFSDNQKNSYTVRSQGVASVPDAPITFIAYAENIATGSPFAVSFDPTDIADSFYGEMRCQEWAGFSTGTEDQVATAEQAGPQLNDATVTTGATTVTNELVISALGRYNDNSGDVHITGPAGYTNLFINQNESGASPGSADYKIISGTGAQTAAYSHDDVDASYGWSEVVVTFKGTDQPSGATTRRRMLSQGAVSE